MLRHALKKTNVKIRYVVNVLLLLFCSTYMNSRVRSFKCGIRINIELHNIQSANHVTSVCVFMACYDTGHSKVKEHETEKILKCILK